MAAGQSIPSITITPLPADNGGRHNNIASKFYRAEGARNPAAPQAVAAAQDFSFFDMLDVINPLQHIPILSSAYRAVTGDETSPTAQLAGGVLFGGPIGGLISLASAVFGELFGENKAVANAAENPAKVATNSKASGPAQPDIMRG